MNENRIKRNALLGARVIKGLESRNMEGYYAETKEEALKRALELIPDGCSVSWGGSMSIGEIGLKEALHKRSNVIYDRELAKNAEEKNAIAQKAFTCDYFLASSNAVTEDGVLINIDGIANRVAAIAYGPKNVLMIVGMNKVVRGEEEALSRARNEAAPINAQRFDIDTPCVKSGGVCYDCKSPDCICCQILTTRYSMVKGRIKVILVDDTLGF